MHNVERFRAVTSFEPVDRLPAIEWAIWWDQTLARWYEEGLPRELTDPGEIRHYLGLDSYRQLRVFSVAATYPVPDHHGAGIVQTVDDYTAVKPHLYPKPIRTRRGYDLGYSSFSSRGQEGRVLEPLRATPHFLQEWASAQQRGETVVWMTLDGFFWHPRVLLGIQRHLYAFYDAPELLHTINRDLLAYQLWVIDQLCQVCTPTFMTFAEDMSYNHGPMLSRRCFDEFLAPYYRQVVPVLKAHGIAPFVDSDGDVTDLIGWLEEVGIEGIQPLERMAGVDVASIRRDHPRFRMIGAFDKTVMHRGRNAMRDEFERLLPVMRQGGFIPSVDHQTPPDVSLAQYRCYVELLKEYCTRAARST